VTEASRREAEEVARREVSDYSIKVIGYDRDNPGGDPKPEELLEWVRQQRDRSRRMAKWLGAIVLMIASAIGTAILSKVTPVVVKFLGL
jgi:hypothetical protein